MVWPWFPSACSSFSLRVTRPDLTGVKLWTLLLNSTCWQVGAHKSGCAIEMPPILQLAEGGGSHQWLGETPLHQLKQWNQTHRCQAFQQQPDQALLQAAHSAAGQQNNAGVHQGDVLEHLGVSPKNTSRGEESRKAFPPEMGTYSNERSGNQVLEKQQLSCQGSNINHPRDTALSPFALITKIPLRSKVKTCFLLLGGEYRCNISISSTSFKAIS